MCKSTICQVTVYYFAQEPLSLNFESAFSSSDVACTSYTCMKLGSVSVALSCFKALVWKTRDVLCSGRAVVE